MSDTPLAETKRSPRGPEHGHWRGMGGRYWYSNLHRWLRRRIRKTGTCPACGHVGKTDLAAIVYANGEPVYDYDESLFGERCRSCNMRLGRFAREHWRD